MGINTYTLDENSESSDKQSKKKHSVTSLEGPAKDIELQTRKIEAEAEDRKKILN